jgi:hypothetical protein
MVLLDALVHEPQPADDVAPLVGQERVRDPVLVGERAEDRHRVIADGEQSDALRL